MMEKNDKILLTIFIIAATILSASQSVVTTGIADIMTDFGVSSTTAQLVYSIFLLILGVMIPTSAYIVKRFKIKNILIGSLGIFTLGSFIAYFSPNIIILILARVIQGIGCGILLPITQIVIFKIIPKEKWQIYMGLFGFIVGIAPALAPTLGGIIIDAMSWRETFLIFGIMAIILVIVSVLFVKTEFETSDYPLDFSSLILCFIACIGIMIGFSNITEFGANIVYVIAPIIIGIICLFIFIKRQNQITHPLLNLKVCKNKYFVWGTLFSAILYFTMCGINVIIPLFVQNVNYYNATTAGLILLPGTIVMIIFNFLGPLLASKIGVRKVLILSCLFSIVGFGTMMTYTTESSINYMMLTQIIRAIGPGLGLMPAVTWTISVIKENIEDATAINNTIRQIIGSIGAALAVVIMAVFAGGSIEHNQASVSAFSSTSLVMILLTIISLIIVLLYVRDDVSVD